MHVQGSARVVDAPPPAVAPLPYACWCIAQGLNELVYLYGAVTDCTAALAGVRAIHYLHRENHATLEQARRCSEQGAQVARESYRGGMKARVLSVAQYQDERLARA